MLLMPASNLGAWALVYQSMADNIPLTTSCATISAFYVAWALRNRLLAGNKLERGYLTYGTLLAGAVLGNLALTLLGALAVAGSIVLVLSKVGPWPLSKLAHVRGKTVLHSAIFKAYLVSMLVQLSVIMMLLLRERNAVP